MRQIAMLVILGIFVHPFARASLSRAPDSNQADGLEISISPLTRSLNEKDPQQMRVTIKNRSAEILVIPDFSAWDKPYPQYLNCVFHLNVYRLEGDNRIEVLGEIEPAKSLGWCGPGAWLDFPAPAPRQLKQNESWSVDIDLGHWLATDLRCVTTDNNRPPHLKNGQYEIAVVYDVSNLRKIIPNHWHYYSQTRRSEWVKITVS